MAEVAALSSVAQLVDSSGRLLALGYGFLAKVARAPKEIRVLLVEVGHMNVLLDQLQSLTTEADGSDHNKSLQSLKDRGIFGDCEGMMRITERCLERCRQSDGHKIKNLTRAIKWPLNDRETKDTMQNLRALQDQLSTALTIDTASTLRRVHDTTIRSHAMTVEIQAATGAMMNEARRERLLRWLAPDSTNMTEVYESKLGERQNGTGGWFLASKPFSTYLTSEGAVFWLYGDPGAGKTILASTVIEHLRDSHAESKRDVVYFYCDQMDSKRQTTKQFLASVALQLLRLQPAQIQIIQRLFDEKEDRSPKPSDYISIIHGLLRSLDRVVCVIDALDESTEPTQFAEALTELSSSGPLGSKLSFFVTSRRDLNIERSIDYIATTKLFLEHSMQSDIAVFVAAEVDRQIRSRSLKLKESSLAQKIVQAIVEGAEGLFLQAKLQLDHVMRLRSDGSIKQAIKELPSGLGSTYEKVLMDILSTTPDEATLIRSILQWLTYSYVPMDLHELAQTLSVRPSDTFLDPDMVATDPEGLIALCRCLVTIDRSHNPPLVALIHSSVKDYLRSDALANSPASFFYIEELSAHLALATACLQYLSFDETESLLPLLDIPEDPYQPVIGNSELYLYYPFYRYATVHWNIHLKASRVSALDMKTEIVPRLEWFLPADGKETRQFTTWRRMRYITLRDDDDISDFPPAFYVIAFVFIKFSICWYPKLWMSTAASLMVGRHSQSRFNIENRK